jgi:hypothetical protein
MVVRDKIAESHYVIPTDEYFWQFCGSRGAFTRNSTEIQWLDSYLTVIIAGSEGRARQYFFFGRKY